MIRCYEFKLKNNKYNDNHRISDLWLSLANYGLEVKKYVIIGNRYNFEYDTLGLYVKDKDLFGDQLLIDNIFPSINLISKTNFPVLKMIPFRFYPIDYEELSDLEEILYSGFHKVTGLIKGKRYDPTILGKVMGDCYELGDKKYSYLFYNIWTSMVEDKFTWIDYQRKIQEI